MMTWCSYLYRYHGMPGHSDPIASLRAPGAVLRYAATYVGAPFSNQNPGTAVILGALAGLAGIGFAVWTLGKMLLRRPANLFDGLVAVVIAFYIATAVETGLGRQTLGVNQAMAGRYETFSLWVWMLLGLVLLRVAARRGGILLLAAQIALIGAIAANVYLAPPTAAAAETMARSGNAASLAVLTGVNDPDTVRAVFPWPEFAWRNVAYLREHRLSVFADPVLSHLDAPFASIYGVSSRRCWAAIDRVKDFNADGQRRLEGWAWDPRRRRGPGTLIFVSGGRIVGFAEGGFPSPQLGARLNLKRAWAAGYVGFVERGTGGAPILAYGLLHRRENEPCPLPAFPGMAQMDRR